MQQRIRDVQRLGTLDLRGVDEVNAGGNLVDRESQGDRVKKCVTTG